MMICKTFFLSALVALQASVLDVAAFGPPSFATRQRNAVTSVASTAAPSIPFFGRGSRVIDVSPAPSKKPRLQREYESWMWDYKSENRQKNKSYKVNYRVEGNEEGRPILLVHGFGANINHFRYNIPALVNAGYRVYAMDLVGFGASEKDYSAPFSIEFFGQQIHDFIEWQRERKQIHQKWIIAGNSMGSLSSLAATAQNEKNQKWATDTVAALLLFNSAGGMTGFRYSDLPIWAHPIMGHVQYYLLNRRFPHGRFVFETLVRKPVIEAVLTQTGIYQDTRNVNEDLLDLLLQPASDPGARDVFLSVYTGPAGPTREELLEKVPNDIPILTLWGDKDPFTPLDEEAQEALKQAATQKSVFELQMIPNAGHCLHDEHPAVINAKSLEFLEKLGLKHGPVSMADYWEGKLDD